MSANNNSKGILLIITAMTFFAMQDALIKFISKENKRIIYIVGNHDGEFLFESMRDFFIDLFPKKSRKNS